jgi:hypothetical protein
VLYYISHPLKLSMVCCPPTIHQPKISRAKRERERERERESERESERERVREREKTNVL